MGTPKYATVYRLILLFFSALLSLYVLKLFVRLLVQLRMPYPFFQGAQANSVWSFPDDSLYLSLRNAEAADF